jgi:hypothetical protein
MTGSLKAARAAVVLVVFVIGVAVLVAVGTRSSPPSPTSAQTTSTTAASGASTTTTGAAGGAASSTTTPTTARHGHASTTTTTAPASHGSVSVVVANATSTNGLAAHFSNIIGAGGWKMGTPIDASTKESTSAVYYASGQQAAATAIATTIGVKPTQVMPLTSATPVNGVTGTDVVVVVGQDLAAASGS